MYGFAGRHTLFRVPSRRGDPPLIAFYVMVADSLLRALARRCAGATVAAFADDMAAALPDWDWQLGAVHDVFERFAAVSNLRLKFHLGDSPTEFKQYFAQTSIL